MALSHTSPAGIGDASPRGPETVVPARGRLSRALPSFVALGRGLATAVVGLFAALSFAFVAAVVVEALVEKDITVQRLSVPKELDDDGLSSEIAALELRDDMGSLAADVRHERGWGLTREIMDPEELPDVVVPSVGLSAQALASNIRAFFKVRSRLVLSGEVVSRDGLLYLTLRINGKPFFRSAEGRRRDRIDDLFGEGARAALRITQPAIGAAIAFDDGDFRTALQVCDRTIREEGKRQVKYARILKARTLAALGRRNEAFKESALLFQRYPREPSPHNNLGTLLASLSRYEEAIAEYKTAIALAPHYALPHTNMGEALRALGRDDEAMRELEAGVALAPSLFAAHLALGEALRASGRADKALDEYRAAAALAPRHAAPHRRLGQAFHDLGQGEEAVAEYRAAVALDPKAAEARRDLAAALDDLGQHDEADGERDRAAAIERPAVARAVPDVEGPWVTSRLRRDDAADDGAMAAHARPR